MRQNAAKISYTNFQMTSVFTKTRLLIFIKLAINNILQLSELQPLLHDRVKCSYTIRRNGPCMLHEAILLQLTTHAISVTK
jgi:hypothetical protein